MGQAFNGILRIIEDESHVATANFRTTMKPTSGWIAEPILVRFAVLFKISIPDSKTRL